MYSELLLTVAVVASVVFFGALITRGNERQRRSIDKLHVAYKQWALHDLRIKRGVAGHQIKIEDLTAWLRKVTAQAFGRETIVMDFHKHEAPVVSVEFLDASTGSTVVCALESPDEMKTILKKKRPTLAGDLRTNPIFRVGKKTSAVELSLLNAGVMFDMELPVAWNMLTGHHTTAETLWAYILD
jgi:hypothetical protein